MEDGQDEVPALAAVAIGVLLPVAKAATAHEPGQHEAGPARPELSITHTRL